MNAKMIFNFLSDLKENNNRDWFQENKHRYEEAKVEMENFVQWLIHEVNAFDGNMDGLTAKESVFRIYKDVRFSKDKTPYKINMGAYICPGGRKSPYGGYYIHLEPGGSFAGGGIYHPQPEILKKIRNEVYYNVDDFKQVIGDKTFLKHFGIFDDSEKLKRPPKGFPADFTDIEYLKFKNYIASLTFKDDEILSQDFPKKLVKIFKAMHPLNAFLYKAIKED